MANCANLDERLFVLMMLGDDRAVAATHVMGEPAGLHPVPSKNSKTVNI